MEVILLEKVRNLGNLGDQVSVKGGFARNFLLPYGKAVIANESNKAEFEARRAELEAAQAEVLAQAQTRASQLEGKVVELQVRASEEGKLFGSVGAREIADALAAQGVEVQRSEVQLPTGPIKECGEFEATLALHAEVNVTIQIKVSPE